MMTDAMDVHELIRRKRERDCRRQYGCEPEELPGISLEELKIRAAASDALAAAAYRGRPPTYREACKIQRYNEIAACHRALTDAKCELEERDVRCQIAREKRDGVYRSPGTRNDLNLLSAILASTAAALAINDLMVFGTGWLFACACLLAAPALLLWNTPCRDPRIDDARSRRKLARKYWRPIL